MITIRSAELDVAISEIGAELQSVVDTRGQDWLWDGDERWWTGRAPLLFPTVGMVSGGIARFGGRAFAMPKHGFARKAPFTVIETLDHGATFRLEDSEATRAVYPFAFRLDVTHRLDGAVLETVATVTNTGDAPMPAGFGFHPALRWPLPGTGTTSKTQHLLRFDAEEPEPIRGVTPDGLIGPPAPTPIGGDELQLHDSLFAHDALVLDRPNSRGLWYGMPDHAGVRVDFAGLNYLGVWMKPGAGYLCIEPWASHADDEGFTGEFADKPGVVTLAPDESRDFAMALTFGVRL